MNKSFLYGIITLLVLGSAIMYIQKSNPSFFSKLMGGGAESWIYEDPGWENNP